MLTNNALHTESRSRVVWQWKIDRRGPVNAIRYLAKMAVEGVITVSWPFDDAFDFATRFASIRPALFEHGMGYDAMTSSSFIAFEGSEDVANRLRAAVVKIDTAFIVSWAEDW
jgi:hypothetical protein